MLGPAALFTESLPAQPSKTLCAIPDALQQLLDKLDCWAREAEQKGLLQDPGQHEVLLHTAEGLRHLKDDLERKWQIAACEGYASSATLAEILEAGWSEWKRITACSERSVEVLSRHATACAFSAI